LIDTRVLVETPEGVDFRFQLAGPGKRLGAYLIDFLLRYGSVVLLAIVGIIAVAVTSVFTPPEISGGMLLGLISVWFFLAGWLYPAVFETLWRGQTPGKRMFSLRVVRANGTPVDAPSAFGRSLLRAADLFPLGFLAAMLSMVGTRRFQRLGDLLFDTMVIDESREFISRAAGVTHGIDAIHRSECPARYHLPERTLAMIERLFENDRIISPARREEIATPLALTIRNFLGYKDPQPDPRNPHAYFQHQAYRHTLFLRRVLATFADKIPPRNPNDPEVVSPDAFAHRPAATPVTPYSPLQNVSPQTAPAAGLADPRPASRESQDAAWSQSAPRQSVRDRRRTDRTTAAEPARSMSLDALFDEWEKEGSDEP
ncbi:MAG: RDD family protein, partial [Planctomycetaceae bacterium]|nr:RDD family protein [Planctomycetaceae bacterium]